MLCGLLGGPRLDKSWLGGDEPIDFFEAKGVVEGLLSRWGVAARFEAGSDESLHPEKQVAMVVGDKRLGVLGEIHPVVLANFEITGAAYLFEIDLAAWLPFTVGHRMYRPIPRFPAIVRDMALVVAAEIAHRQVVDIIKGFPLVEQVAIFDVYSGEQVPAGQKSLAYRITFQSPTQTLTDDEVNGVQQQFLARLVKEIGAVLRG